MLNIWKVLLWQEENPINKVFFEKVEKVPSAFETLNISIIIRPYRFVIKKNGGLIIIHFQQ